MSYASPPRPNAAASLTLLTHLLVNSNKRICGRTLREVADMYTFYVLAVCNFHINSVYITS